jgi:hypothetical protein
MLNSYVALQKIEVWNLFSMQSLYGAMRTIEIVASKNWLNLWLQINPI